MSFDIAMFQQAFFEEALELLADLEALLLKLEETPDNREVLNTIFRCAHSIKGGAATFGVSDLAHFTHSVETLLDLVRNGQVRVTPELAQLLLESLDQMKMLLAVAMGDAASAPDSTSLKARLDAACVSADDRSQLTDDSKEDGEDESWGFWNPITHYDLLIAPGADVMAFGSDPLLLLSQLAEIAEILSLECDASLLPPLDEMNPEKAYLSWKLKIRTDRSQDDILEIFDFIADESEIVLTPCGATVAVAQPSVEAIVQPRTDPSTNNDSNNAGETPAPPSKAENPKLESATIRVAADKVDKLINLVGELVIHQSMLNEATENFSIEKLPRLMEAVTAMERASRELQERVMGIRLVQLKQAFARFPRLVRDLCSTTGKKIELKTTGEETELDKSLIEAISDPLTHLIRNSADHGIESPLDRKAAGKPETGQIQLNAWHEGGNVIIDVVDDGKGLDKDKILKKSYEKGLFSEGDQIPNDEGVYALIFEPGFSTAAAITDVSGRGVGMDIVRQSIQKMNGSITLASTPGQGTRFRIRLPLTMAILEGLLLRVGQETYIIPLTSIVESIQPSKQDLSTIAGRDEVVSVRGEVLPILRLHDVFDTNGAIQDPSEALLVIVENEGRKVALLVDELIGQNQVVIKSMEANYRKVDGIAGATILGDGRVSLILDIPQLIRIRRNPATYGVAA